MLYFITCLFLAFAFGYGLSWTVGVAALLFFAWLWLTEELANAPRLTDENDPYDLGKHRN